MRDSPPGGEAETGGPTGVSSGKGFEFTVAFVVGEFDSIVVDGRQKDGDHVPQ